MSDQVPLSPSYACILSFGGTNSRHAAKRRASRPSSLSDFPLHHIEQDFKIGTPMGPAADCIDKENRLKTILGDYNL